MLKKKNNLWKESGRDERFWIKQIGAGMAFIGCLAYVFYRSVWGCLWIFILGYPYVKWCRKRLIKEKRDRFTRQFRDFLQMLAGNLQAGDSVDHAIENCLPELRRLWGMDAFICRDLEQICKQISLSHQTAKVMTLWGKNREDPELLLFLQIFLYGKNSGGDLCLTISKSAESITRRVETSQQIQTLLSAKKYEQEIMSIVPIIILLYVGLTNPEYLSELYGNLTGILFMTGCCLVYAIACFIGIKIMDIKVE